MTITNLVVQLQADASSFHQGLNDAAEAQAAFVTQIVKDGTSIEQFANALEFNQAGNGNRQLDALGRGMDLFAQQATGAGGAVGFASQALLAFGGPEMLPVVAAIGLINGLFTVLGAHAAEAAAKAKAVHDEVLRLAEATPEGQRQHDAAVSNDLQQSLEGATQRARDLQQDLKTWVSPDTRVMMAASGQFEEWQNRVENIARAFREALGEVKKFQEAIHDRNTPATATVVVPPVPAPCRCDSITDHLPEPPQLPSPGAVSVPPPAQQSFQLRGGPPQLAQDTPETAALRASMERPVQNNLLKALNDLEKGASLVGAVVSVVDDMRGAIVSLAGPSAEKFFGPFKIIAKLLAGFEIAEGIKSLAAGIWPPNPAALAAAATHFKAAQHFAQIGGGGGGGGGGAGGGGGGGGESSFFKGGNLRPGSQAGPGTLTVVFPTGGSFLDPNNPDHQNAFVDFLRNITERNIVVVPGT